MIHRTGGDRRNGEGKLNNLVEILDFANLSAISIFDTVLDGKPVDSHQVYTTRQVQEEFERLQHSEHLLRDASVKVVDKKRDPDTAIISSLVEELDEVSPELDLFL